MMRQKQMRSATKKFYSEPNRGLVAKLLYPIPDKQRERLDKLAKGNWLIARDDIILADRIGKGEFGEVLRATYNGSQVAVKIYQKHASKLAITYEACLMTKLKHPNLVTFIGLAYEPDTSVYYLVSEYLPNGSLLTYLHSRTMDEIGDSIKLKFSIDVCCGLTYLEKLELVHRDIAARNVLLAEEAAAPTGNLVAKLTDFGMARDLHDSENADYFTAATSTSPTTNSSSDDQTNKQQNPPSRKAIHDKTAIPLKWTAPEAVRERLFTTKSDVWSYGILLWEIYSYGRIPYPRMMASQVLNYIESGYRMKIPDSCPMSVYRLMQRTWLTDPAKRPTFQEILPELHGLMKQQLVGVSNPTSNFPTPIKRNQTTRECPKTLAELISDPTDGKSAMSYSFTDGLTNHEHNPHAIRHANHNPAIIPSTTTTTTSVTKSKNSASINLPLSRTGGDNHHHPHLHEPKNTQQFFSSNNSNNTSQQQQQQAPNSMRLSKFLSIRQGCLK